jgi:hypothetical protein
LQKLFTRAHFALALRQHAGVHLEVTLLITAEFMNLLALCEACAGKLDRRKNQPYSEEKDGEKLGRGSGQIVGENFFGGNTDSETPRIRDA